MGTAARKARKRAGIPHSAPQKKPTRPYGAVKGMGFVSSHEILAGMLVRGTL